MAEMTRFNGASLKAYKVTGAPGAVTNEGVLIVGRCKTAEAPGSYPYTMGNHTPIQIVSANGTNSWRAELVLLNLTANVNSANDANENGNFQFFADSAFNYVNDYAAIVETQNLSESQVLGEHYWAIQFFYSSTELRFKYWLAYGQHSPIFYAEQTVTVATIQGDPNVNNSWVPGAITRINIGDGEVGGSPNTDEDFVRIFENQPKPTDAQLRAIWKNPNAVAGAWADFRLDVNSGTPNLADRSGNGRNLTVVGTAPTAGATPELINPPIAPIQVKRGYQDGAGALVISFDTLPTIGNRVIAVGTSRDAGVVSCTDNQGPHSYSTLSNAPTGNDKSVLHHTVVATSSGTFTVTITDNSGSEKEYWLYELPPCTLDWSSTPNTSTAGLTITAPQADSVAGVIVFCPFIAANQFVTSFAPTGYSVEGNDGVSGRLATKITTAIGTQSVVIPAPSSGNVSGILVAFAPNLVPQFSVQPTNQIAAEGAAATFSATVTGATSYQWERQSPLGGAWANVSGGSGGTTNSYTTPSLTRAGDTGAWYRLKATNVSGNTYSNEVYLQVINLPVDYSGIGLVTGAADSFTGEAMTGGPISIGGGPPDPEYPEFLLWMV